MATACGIHIDQRRFRLIALDGSPKKHKIVAHFAGEVLPGEDPVAAISAALRRVGKENKLRPECVGLVVSSGLAAFRNLSLPFDDRGKIEEVLKFEIESDLPQWDIDNVVVDFLVTDSKPGVQSNLLVTAIPKEHLAPKLAACEKGGFEATEAELDGAALFDVAREAGLLGPDSAQVLVFVGDSSTTVVVADGGKLLSMRAIRAGAQPLEAAPPPLPGGGEEEEGFEDDDSLAPLPELPAVDPAKLERTIQRIRRELGRTISGAQTAHPIEGVYVCGRALPGFLGEEILDVPMASLEALPTASGIPDSAEMMVAYGAALHQLGGGELRPRLRREELRFTGKFERLELPLAVFALLLVTLLAVKFIVVDRQIQWRDRDLQTWLEASNTFMLPSSAMPANTTSGVPYPGRIKTPSEELVAYCLKAQNQEDGERTKYEEISEIRRMLRREIDVLEKRLGQKRDFEQPLSALEGLTLVMGTIDDLGEQVGRVGLRSVTSTYKQGKAKKPDTVEVKLDLDFLEEDSINAAAHLTALEEAIRAAPWYVEYEPKGTKAIEGGLGLTVDGMTISVDPRAVVEE